MKAEERVGAGRAGRYRCEPFDFVFVPLLIGGFVGPVLVLFQTSGPRSLPPAHPSTTIRLKTAVSSTSNHSPLLDRLVHHKPRFTPPTKRGEASTEAPQKSERNPENWGGGHGVRTGSEQTLAWEVCSVPTDFDVRHASPNIFSRRTWNSSVCHSLWETRSEIHVLK